MNIELPNFVEGVDFRKLSPDESYKYRYTTLKPIIVKKTGLVAKGAKVSCVDGKGREWLYIDSEHFIILKGYSWNGCSPKLYISFIGWIGTIDFQNTILASLIHDTLVQFCKTKNFPLERKSCDNIFRDVLILKNFKWYKLYYTGAKLGTFIDYKKFDTKLKVILTYRVDVLNTHT